jgi:hypothetical protein
MNKLSTVVILAVLVMSMSAFAQEHPEHPTEGTAAEHPADDTAAEAVTPEMIAVAINTIIATEQAANDGHYMINDEEAGAMLTLALDHVHEERLSVVSENLFFACADFTTAEGVTYDLDFWMSGTNADDLAVTQVTVHKQDGVERYTWAETDGVWSQVTLGDEGHEHPESDGQSEGATNDAPEHPEHPE